ncbi:acyl carrier protein [Oleiphilus messinensis]|uniref:Acyl carrier protein n=1 Tax=Oleiphilus messinensis TaxID=141451 RepID=A0A1Y0I9W7_9GAMM|nr:acyl carrier protein [Oleiphilus messinensis]ARU56183.1 acyl carrier protein [Oleiphilus messinensis]
MSELDQVKAVLSDVLGVDASGFDESTVLLGAIPEFDSMAVVSIITALEDNLGIFVEDDEISAETFETLGALSSFVQSKL